MIEITSISILLLILLLTICLGVLLTGIVFYIYIYIQSKQPLHLAMVILGFLGAFFIGFELLVILCTLIHEPFLALKFHRFEALSALFFIVGIPFFMNHFVSNKHFFVISHKKIVIGAFIISLIFLFISFFFPHLFLSQNNFSHPGIGFVRGIPGPVYFIRNMIIGLIMMYALISIIREFRYQKRNRFIYLILIGVVIAILSGVIDLVKGLNREYFGIISYKYFSAFSFGLTIQIILFMVGVIQQFIDQTKNIERALKIESLGLFAGGIAHDFNNMLTAISGNISILKQNCNDENENQKVLHDIEKAAFLASELTHQLLTFSKGGTPVKIVTSIKTLLKDTTNFIMSGSPVKVVYEIDDDLWNADVDQGQLSQVIHNLLLNSLQAITDHGLITVSASNEIEKSDREKVKYIKISIKDNGGGMSKKEQGKIFDPYYTTKDTGTGLGLSITKSIIERHNGTIDFDSKLSTGTTFTILLPATEAPPAQVHIDHDIRSFEGKRVLVMDDDEMIIKTVVRMLQLIGCNPECALHGEDAIDKYMDALGSGEPFDAVILDLTVPGGLGGKDTMNRLLQLDRSVKGIVSSGYSNDPIFSDFKGYGFSGMVLKPYNVDDLRIVLQKVIFGDQ